METSLSAHREHTGHLLTLSHALLTHLGQFTEANEPTKPHVFGLWEEIGAPGGNHVTTGRTLDLVIGWSDGRNISFASTFSCHTSIYYFQSALTT